MKITISSGSAEPELGSVILGFGPQPIDWLNKAIKVAGKQSEIDPDVARMAGAHFAIGTREALDELRKRLEPGDLQETTSCHPGLSQAAALWLAHGRRGQSSETIFSHLTGVDALRGNSPTVPYDPADLRRCRLLLEQVPELVREFHRMASAKPGSWAFIVKAWPELCATMDEECPGWRTGMGKAPKTYELLKSFTR